MNGLQQRLRTRKLLVADGAWGTQLTRAGLPAGLAPEAWNLSQPDAVRVVAASYVAAGADIILTNTFGGNRFKLAKAGLDEKLVEVNRQGAAVSRAAAGKTALVFASIGPTGEFMAPLGTVTEDEMIACYAEQVRALAAGGADGFVIETFIDLNEAKAALRAVRQETKLPAVVSLTFDKGAARIATIMGTTPEVAAKELEAAGADVIGANCGAGIADMIEVIRELRAATKKPLWAKPNAGRPELVAGQTVFRETPDVMAARVAELVEAGATIVGGCCGTTPEHIKRIAAEVRKLGAR